MFFSLNDEKDLFYHLQNFAHFAVIFTKKKLKK